MTFIILFEDNPAADPDIRKTHMAAHLAFLDTHAASILAAGPLFSPGGAGPGGAAAGGLWLVEAESAGAAAGLVHEDPFWPTGLRQGFTVLEWKRVFLDGRRLIDPA